MLPRLNIWTQPSGYSFGTFDEQVLLSTPNPGHAPIEGLPLPVTNDAGVTYSVISGTLPGGVYISGNKLVGAPYLVQNLIEYKFCIRAHKSGYFIPDRTFSITVNSATPPIFITPAGSLPVGVNKQLYALDSSYIDYQIEAYDINPLLTTNLKFFIASGDGHLPPGLTLSQSGRITGFLKPLLVVTPESGSGTYDEVFFDKLAYDFHVSTLNGYEDYTYDDIFFDYSTPHVQPASLNANYQFKVTLTDGSTYSQRIYRILVVGNDQFRADSTVLDGFAGGFTADSTFIRNPVWATDKNLGFIRADNYITIPIALYDNTETIFELSTTNQEIFATTSKITSVDNVVNGTYVTITADESPSVGQYFSFYNSIPGATGDIYKITNVLSLDNNQYRLTISTPLLLDLVDHATFYIGSLSQLPEGTSFDVNTGEVYGVVPYQPAITKVYSFTISAKRMGNTGEYVASSRNFTITVLGDVTSKMTWSTGSDLGSIPAAYISTLSVSATSNVPNAIVYYKLIDGTLPPGLSLTLDGELIGKVNEFYNSSTGLLGITTIDGIDGDFTLDNGATTIDKVYTFTIQASDQFNYSSITRTFTVAISTPNTVNYSNITTRPFLAPTQRALWRNFINDSTIFTPSSIYRTNDDSFGLRTDLSMLVYAGLETREAAAYVGAMGLNHKRKRFAFGNVKKAVAIDPDTNKEIYEVVYVEMVDLQEFNGKHLPSKVHFTSFNSSKISSDNKTNLTVDSVGYNIADTNTNTYFPNSISNWQERLKNTLKITGQDAFGAPIYDGILTERNYLPLWMRTIQPGEKEQLGHILAVPLCYCKVGTADTIILNIKFSGFDFKNIDYTVDRYIIDSVTGYNSDKYLVFRNDRITV